MLLIVLSPTPTTAGIGLLSVTVQFGDLEMKQGLSHEMESRDVEWANSDSRSKPGLVGLDELMDL